MKKSLECPVCKARHELEMPENQLVYQCPKCKLRVRCMPPQEIEVPKPKNKRVTVEVKSAEEIPAKVTEAIKKEAAKVLEEKKASSKTSTKKKKASSKSKKSK